MLLSETKNKKAKQKGKKRNTVEYIKPGTEEYNYIITKLGLTLRPSEQIIKIGDQYEIIEYVIEEEIQELENQIKKLKEDDTNKDKNESLIKILQ